jgi:hypothetical protein
MSSDEIVERLYLHYTNQLENRRITFERTETYSISTDEFRNSLEDVSQRLKIKLTNGGICSQTLITQLAKHKCNLGESFINVSANDSMIEFYNVSEIIDLIENIEQKKRTGTFFSGLVLGNKGLQKIHHNAYSGIGYSLILNIRNYWFTQTQEIKERKHSEFNAILEKIGTMDLPAIANELHNRAVHSRQLTGEWLIYKEFKNRIYYLCLAIHEEGDENIFDNKIKITFSEFPELS